MKSASASGEPVQLKLDGGEALSIKVNSTTQLPANGPLDQNNLVSTVTTVDLNDPISVTTKTSANIDENNNSTNNEQNTDNSNNNKGDNTIKLSEKLDNFSDKVNEKVEELNETVKHLSNNTVEINSTTAN